MQVIVIVIVIKISSRVVIEAVVELYAQLAPGLHVFHYIGMVGDDIDIYDYPNFEEFKDDLYGIDIHTVGGSVIVITP